MTLYYYSDPVRAVLHAFKYERVKSALNELINSALNFGYSDIWQFMTHLNDVKQNIYICPIPLHPAKHRKRGFNQSEVFWQYLTHQLRMYHKPTMTAELSKFKTSQLLIRTKSAQALALSKNKLERHLITHGLYAINPAYLGAQPSTVILIDDVITTGNTINEACRVLKLAGIGKVYAICLARD